MKKIQIVCIFRDVLKYFSVLFFFLILQLSLMPAFGAGKGGFFVLNWGPSGRPYVTGGTALIDWRDFEPNEGQYRWELLTDRNARFISWKGYYDARMNGTAPADQAAPAKFFYDAHTSGGTIRFKLRVTEGAVPLWLYGGEDADGRRSSSYGTICAYKNYEQVYSGNPDCNPNTNIVIAITYPLYPTKEDNAEPVWWNPVFQSKLKRTLKAIGQKIESDPVLSSSVEFTEASVGSYGEMILYGKTDTFTTDSPNQRLFKRAGYTNAVYSQAVQDVIGAYMEAFKTIPIAISLGGGLYSSPINDGSGVLYVEDDAIPKLMNRWGGRLYLKFSGFGGGGGRRGGRFRTYCPQITRCIYESFGGITQWQGWPWGGNHTGLEQIFQYAIDDHAYIIMMWYADWEAISQYPDLERAFVDIYPRLREIGAVEPVISTAMTFNPGWNSFSGQSMAGSRYSSVPVNCLRVSFRGADFWRSFVRDFGGNDDLFAADRKYDVMCR